MVDFKNVLSAKDAVADLKKYSEKEGKRNFLESVDICVVLSPSSQVSGNVVLPNGSGRKNIVAAFVSNEAEKNVALESGASLVGSNDLVDKFLSGEVEFNYCVATQSAMKYLSSPSIAKKLSLSGMMPSVKNGTLGDSLDSLISDGLKGKISFKSGKLGLIQASVGRVNFSDEHLVENISAFLAAIFSASNIGPSVVRKCYLSSTMGRSLLLSGNFL